MSESHKINYIFKNREKGGPYEILIRIINCIAMKKNPGNIIVKLLEDEASSVKLSESHKINYIFKNRENGGPYEI